jgi:hypothetical protein
MAEKPDLAWTTDKAFTDAPEKGYVVIITVMGHSVNRLIIDLVFFVLHNTT